MSVALQNHVISLPQGMDIIVETRGDPASAPVIFLHGGGQTRRSWKQSLERVAALGFYALAYDARGHGESTHSPEGDYRLEAMADDLAHVAAFAGGVPILVGASLGGVTALTYAGRTPCPPVKAIALVDVSLRANQQERKRILDFMNSGTKGFASLEEAAAALQAYNPNRPMPRDLSNLERVLNKRDGKYYWHWDPRFATSRIGKDNDEDDMLEAAGRTIKVPTLLVHAGRSAFVTSEELAHLRECMPHCEYVRVEGAGHMVAGDANSHFNNAIIDFIQKVHVAPARAS